MTYMTGELSIICRAHRRRCYLVPPGDYPARICHEGGAGDICVGSSMFLVRHEEEYTRDRVLGELVEEATRK